MIFCLDSKAKITRSQTTQLLKELKIWLSKDRQMTHQQKTAQNRYIGFGNYSYIRIQSYLRMEIIKN